MNEFFLKKMLDSKELVIEKIKAYVDSCELFVVKASEEEIKGHIAKSKHNIKFVSDTMKQGYHDWALVGCYYAAYHAALSMILHKGYSSKNHDATLSVLIKEYYKKSISDEEIILLNLMYLGYSDVLFYAQSKNEREKASYSSQIIFDNKMVEDIKLKTVLFVNKCEAILKRNIKLD